jgi:competence protein ComEA
MKKWLWLLVLCSMNAIATPVNVNRADAQTISESLIGVSFKKAQAIVAYRQQNGDFKTVADLKRVFGIGEKTLAVNSADILLSNPPRHSRTRERHGHTRERRQ